MRALVTGRRRLIAAQAAMFSAVIGAGVSYALLHKDVTLSVDGRVTHVRSMSGTVQDFLDDQDVSVGARDIVAPGPGSALSDGSTVVVRYARPFTLTVDGRRQTYWTTELSVDKALDAIGVRAAGAQLSASRSQPIGRDGLTMWLSTPKDITLVVGGTAQKVTTTAPTVAALLTSRSVEVGSLDRLSVVPSAPVVDGQTVRLTRIERREVTREESVAYDTVTRKNSSMYTDQRDVVRSGRSGSRTATYTITLADGKVATRKLVGARVLSAPRAEIVEVGTKKRPYSESVGGSADSLNWPALARCESGGNPRAVNPAGYYGLYQFSLATWRSVGGSGNPIDASPSEQLYRAKILYNKAGAGQWGCGRHLFT